LLKSVPYSFILAVGIVDWVECRVLKEFWLVFGVNFSLFVLLFIGINS